MKYKALKIKGKRIDEHRYIIEQYLGRKLNRDEVVHHINGNKSDNRLENLQVMSRSEHSRLHALENKDICRLHSQEAREKHSKVLINNRKLSKRVGRYDKQGNLLEEYLSTMDAQRKGGFCNKHISACCNNKRKTHKGFVWKYLDDTSYVSET